MTKKKKYIAGNWKSNKTVAQVAEWFGEFHKLSKNDISASFQDKTVIVFPSFLHIPLAVTLRDKYKLPIEIGAQDVSPFTSGAYTGAISADMLSEFVKYAIIGHSERRKNFLENDEVLTQKEARLKEKNITPIYCVPDKDTFVPEDVSIVAYEPVWAIGTGKTESPEIADKVASEIKKKHQECNVLYGGSVSPDNVADFAAVKYIDGFLPGGASLDPRKFWEIIIHASIY